MDKKRVLIVTQEMDPYLNLSSVSNITSALPKDLQDSGLEIRVLMPKFGNINERRHRLHEVVRLSGINISIDDEDYPLIIKVASLPGARLQVYFLDNEEFFKRKSVFEDENGKMHNDNTERTVFFCKGVLETVKKFGWAPDYIHCHGWMTSLVPFYLKTVYRDEPVFQNARTVYSVYENGFEGVLSEDFTTKAKITSDIEDDLLKPFAQADNTSLYTAGSEYADGVIVGCDSLDKKVSDFLSSLNDKPLLEYKNGDTPIAEEYMGFYESLDSSN